MDPDTAFELLDSQDGEVRRASLAWLTSDGSAYLRMMDRAFALNLHLIRLLAEHSRKDELPDGPLQAIAVLLRTRQHFWAAWNLLLSGSYLDCLNAIKIAHESYLLADYLSKDSGKAKAWAGGKKIHPASVRKALPASVEEGVRDTYANICRVAHPNSDSLGFLRQLDHNGEAVLQCLSRFDEKIAREVLRRLRRELWSSLMLLAGITSDQGIKVSGECRQVLYALAPPEYQAELTNWRAEGRPKPE